MILTSCLARHLLGFSAASSLKEIVMAERAADSNRFKNALLDGSTFCVTWEQVPGRGASEKEREAILQNSELRAWARH